MTATLADLIAPVGIDEFQQCLRHRDICFGKSGPATFAALLDWSGLMELVLTGAYPVEELVLTKGGGKVARALYTEGNAPRRDVIEQLMRAGGSIVAYGLDPYVPALTSLCAGAADLTGDRVTGGAIATNGPGGALDLHYDSEDLLMLQVDGRKRWLIQAEPFPNPILRMAKPPADESAPVLIDKVFEPGDWMFLPAGYWHRCETVGERSLHLGIVFQPLTAVRVVELMRKRLVGDVDARAPLRFDPADTAAAERTLKERLTAQIDALSLEELLAIHREQG